MNGFLNGRDVSGRLAWLDFDAYAARVFAGDGAPWLTNAALRIATLERAQSIVRSDVVVIDIAAPYLAGGSPRSALFRDESASTYIEMLLDAAGHRLARAARIVLSMPSPRDLVTGGDDSAGEPDFSDLDDMAMAAGDLLRRLSERPIGGLCIDFSDQHRVTEDEIAALEPLSGSARHYGWNIAVRLHHAEAPDPTFLAAMKADVFLYPDSECATEGDGTIITGLGQDFWSGRRREALPRRFCGIVPDHLAPEDVLKRLADLSSSEVSS